MEKKYISTRNQQKEINFYQAIVQGIGEDGGLLVPDFDFTKMDLDVLSKLNYVDHLQLSILQMQKLFLPHFEHHQNYREFLLP